ncbi:MAG: tRNA (adenosine(37)-N6)-threonylcarbamoyltransferase complex ATPase subunit type 1 TsaE [Christensenellales bacterium]|jgi:tRNA threonylcarbamoyladenosine biosynthesis protein TsaE
MPELVIETAENMQALGEEIAGKLIDKDVILLTGDMGAGKSELARGIARGLGIAGPIPSPSFTILNLYDGGRLVLNHFDWYRIEDSQELYLAGLDEFIGNEGVTLIEWHERAKELLPDTYLEIIIKQLDDGCRTVEFKPCGNFRPFSI